MSQRTVRRRADVCLCSAYWIAFGPHGPRALPPPGENWMVFRWTMTAIGIAAVMTWGIRLMARPPPSTMNAQYQEMTNEYLKVSDSSIKARLPSAAFGTCRTDLCFLLIETKNRANHWCFLRRLLRQGNGAKQAKAWATPER